MASLATAVQLAAHLQQTVDTASADQALTISSGAIRTHCRWSISQEVDRVDTIDADGGRSIWLPTLLLTAVGSVVEKSVPLVVVDDYDWTRYGRLIRVGRWPCEPRSVVVTYTHGHVTVPGDVLGVCLDSAARLYGNPEMLQQLTIGGVSETRALSLTEVGALLTKSEMALLGSYRVDE